MTKTGVQLAFDQLLNAPLVIAGFFAAFQTVIAIAEGLVTCSVPQLALDLTSSPNPCPNPNSKPNPNPPELEPKP